MSVIHLPNTHYANLLSASSTPLIGSDVSWLVSLRERASTEFAEAGFPAPRDEEWRYTNITAIEKSQFTLAEKAGEVEQASLDEVLLEGCHHMVFVDGFYQSAYSSLSGLPDDVTVLPLSETLSASEEQQDLFKALISNKPTNDTSTKRFIIIVCLILIAAMVIANICGVDISDSIFWGVISLCGASAGLTMVKPSINISATDLYEPEADKSIGFKQITKPDTEIG